MTRPYIDFAENNDLFLFEDDSSINKCQLKNFLHFLNSQGLKRPYKFAFVESEGPLLNNLTIRENIHLDSIPNSLTSSKNFQMENFVSVTGNIHLSHFYSGISELDGSPTNVDKQTRKMAALLKALLQDSTYLFLESPEKYLSQKNLDLFIKTLKHQIDHHGLVVFINTPKKHLWSKFATKVVSRDNAYKFQVKPLPCVIKIEQPSSNEFPILDSAWADRTNFDYLTFHNINSVGKKSA